MRLSIVSPDRTPFGSARYLGSLAALRPGKSPPEHGTGAPGPFDLEHRDAARILVVEDDRSIQSALAALLRDEGYQVSTACDGDEALRRLEVGALPDLIVLDLRMPIMDGWEFRTAQRRDSRLATIPVVAMSADGSSQAAAISAQAFLKKPVSGDDLLTTIERVLSEDEKRRDEVRWSQVERLASLGRVAAGVGHEINNPLAFVQLSVDFAHERLQELQRACSGVDAERLPSQDPPDPMQTQLRAIGDALADARPGLDRIRGIVSNLQRLSKRPDGKWEAVDVERVLDESLAFARHQIQHRARIVKRYEELPHVTGHAGGLGQVFLNLLINAAQAIPEGGADDNQITILTSCRAGDVLIEIHDTGRGIQADVLPYIFDPFFTTKGATEGTGLGLAISQQIVTEHHGRLTVSSEPGRGTVCRVSLPVSGPFDVADGEDKEPAVALPPSSGLRGRVLVIDDEPMIGRFIAKILSRDHDVVAVQSAQEAFRQLDAGERFDLILCDLLMPNVGGAAVYDAIASRWPSQLDCLVIMTGGASSPEAASFLERTACPILLKPFDAEELKRLVDARRAQRIPI